MEIVLKKIKLSVKSSKIKNKVLVPDEGKRKDNFALDELWLLTSHKVTVSIFNSTSLFNCFTLPISNTVPHVQGKKSLLWETHIFFKYLILKVMTGHKMRLQSDVGLFHVKST